MPNPNGTAAGGAAAAVHTHESPQGTTLEVFEQRLERAAEAVDDQRVALQAAIEQRDALIVEGRDLHAMTTTKVARVAKISQARVVVILAAH